MNRMLILLPVILVMAVIVYGQSGRVLSFYGVAVRLRKIRAVRLIFSVLLCLLCFQWRLSGMFLIHIIVVFALADVIASLLCCMLKRRSSGKVYKIIRGAGRSGIIPFLIVCLMFGYGAYNMTRLVRTEYTVTSDKLLQNYRIILITDTHYDTIQNPDVIKNKIEEMNALEPDIIVLGGDIVEEGTSKEAMQEIFQVLGSIEAKYGTYYVYGNHDKQPYTEQPAYTEKELEQAILSNNITILKDQWITINDDLLLAGRDDAAWGNQSDRALVEELLQGADRERYMIMLDHQPTEAEENDSQGVDLELSGHTHAGQIFPVGHISEWTGTLNYGEYQRGNCKVIVSSGATGWGYPIRTEGKCEYVVIDLKNK